jgi:hypothetical protein
VVFSTSLVGGFGVTARSRSCRDRSGLVVGGAVTGVFLSTSLDGPLVVAAGAFLSASLDGALVVAAGLLFSSSFVAGCAGGLVIAREPPGRVLSYRAIPSFLKSGLE